MKKNLANSLVITTGSTLTFFWVVNIVKTADKGFSDVLNFYPPVGPLLGVYLLSLVAFALFMVLSRSLKVNSAVAFWFYVITTLLFFFMVFPPVFEPVAHVIGG
jgi:hypothetical protein